MYYGTWFRSLDAWGDVLILGKGCFLGRQGPYCGFVRNNFFLPKYQSVWRTWDCIAFLFVAGFLLPRNLILYRATTILNCTGAMYVRCVLVEVRRKIALFWFRRSVCLWNHHFLRVTRTPVLYTNGFCILTMAYRGILLWLHCTITSREIRGDSHNSVSCRLLRIVIESQQAVDWLGVFFQLSRYVYFDFFFDHGLRYVVAKFPGSASIFWPTNYFMCAPDWRRVC